MNLLQAYRRRLALAETGALQRLLADLRAQGITDERVLAAMDKVFRPDFVDDAFKNRAFENTALPIGHAQTISQPLVVALMTQQLIKGRKPQKVLEIGTGSGYQTAVLAELVPIVYTVERIKALSEQARQRLAALGYRNIHFGYSDGSQGWLPYAPYDGILVAAGADNIPEGLLKQLAPGGRLIIPVGGQSVQMLKSVERRGAGFYEEDLGRVSFVPLLGGRV
ncbi:protein-L-isoaspartate(D-aspartate) O-methyltransferase [Sinimarinibacterium sp. NLF-5-8]|uniref:protein-L-isoaspartate(D-aspartate) O-methyltransferase n=1 Tax=Sinimarinibacterium sp. NLF-5-8 TaxID=2698684 RepID=UPI00137BBA02|nr:protein-L-isoaspartate(D-aspartate) O-methyltransferase [Sinimarinibacterium sp. NLF-5-8]QHS09386.1 protein-L-isoaspartate(D-aspartate) O-methyltransferase [Sinimarinibacterium sp. NLF-5-8]